MRLAATDILVHLNQRYRLALMSFFVRRVRDRTEAEDLTQEVFVRLAHQKSVSMDNADAYIFQMAANLLRDRGRRFQVRARFQDGAAFDEFPSSDEIDPSRILIGRESLQDVALVLQKLPLRTRAIFLLFRLEDMKQGEIALLYGISVSGVRKHLHKAMTHLTRHFGEGE